MTKCATCENYHEGPCLYATDIPAHGVPADAAAVEPTPNQKPEERLPQPPQQFAATFLPLLKGIQQGMAARLQLLELTEYCISLEIALGEMERKHLTTAADLGSRPESAALATETTDQTK